MQQKDLISSVLRELGESHKKRHQQSEWQHEMANSLKDGGWTKDQFFTHKVYEGYCTTHAHYAMDGEDMKDATSLARQADALVQKIIRLLDKRLIMGEYQIRVSFFNRNVFMSGSTKVFIARMTDGKLKELAPRKMDPVNEKHIQGFTVYLLTLHAFLLHPGHFFFPFYDPITDAQGSGNKTLGVVKIIGPGDTITPPPDRVRMVKDLRNYSPEGGLYETVCFRFISQHNGLCMKIVLYTLWPEETDTA